jgi:hypothetical protein
MWKAAALIATVSAALAWNVGVARADTYQDFSISGTYNTYADGSFSFTGGMSIDITTDQLAGLSVGIPGASPITIEHSIGNMFGAADGYLDAGGIFITMTPDGLGDGFYSGGSLGGSAVPVGAAVTEYCSSNPAPCNAEVTGFSGTVYIPGTPLPAALPLFATGLSAIGLLGWRRKRKNTSACEVRGMSCGI